MALMGGKSPRLAPLQCLDGDSLPRVLELDREYGWVLCEKGYSPLKNFTCALFYSYVFPSLGCVIQELAENQPEDIQ